jgi:hypothetical protein
MPRGTFIANLGYNQRLSAATAFNVVLTVNPSCHNAAAQVKPLLRGRCKGMQGAADPARSGTQFHNQLSGRRLMPDGDDKTVFQT